MALVAATAAQFSGAVALAQTTTRLGDSCDLSVVGAKERSTFLTFDRELRAALSSQDTAAMALLVRFPLRVNTGHGNYSLNDPAILQARFGEVFSPAIRSAILGQKTASVFCDYTGVTYGDGAIWINITQHGYAIEVVNLTAVPSAEQKPGGRENVFVCHTDRHRIVIDLDVNGVPRYRAWNIPRSPSEEPDLEISTGKKDFEGTGPCAYAVWTFRSGTNTYSVEEVGCVPTPKDASGRLTVSTNGKRQAEWWCY